ncbi:MAG: 50S ribosomal protein L13 [Chlamydiales bacterium]|nr:50S ribosomal protein L13 [Chlamydiales bacterium]
MKQQKMQSPMLTKEEAAASSQWYLIDAKGKTLGRLATEVAKILRGKHKVTFTTHVDGGDGVIIINAEKVVITGAKAANKVYRYYTGSMGGLREIPYRTMLARKPDYVLRHAVEGMMPKTKLGNKQLKKLRIYAGEKHSMQAQKPTHV